MTLALALDEAVVGTDDDVTVSDESGTYTYRADPAVIGPQTAGTTEGGQLLHGDGVVYTWHFDPTQNVRNTGWVKDYFTYDAANRLSKIETAKWAGPAATPASWVEQGRTTLDIRGYDAASRVVKTGPGTLAQAYADALNKKLDASGNPVGEVKSDGNGSSNRVTVYDANGRIIKERTRKADGTWDYDLENLKTITWTTTEPVQAQDAHGNLIYDPKGAAVYYEVALDESGNAVLYESGYPVPVLDGSGNAIYPTTTVTHSERVSGFDAAGNIQHYDINQPGGMSVSYDFTPAKYDGYKQGKTVGWRSDNESHWGTTTHQYDANGHLIGINDATEGGYNRTFVNDVLGHALLKTQLVYGHRVRQLVVDGNVIGEYGYGTDPSQPLKTNGDLNLTTIGNFDLNYQPISGASALASPGSYTVRVGDTLQGIAQAVYGDASLWYLIADANGVRGNEGLRVGQPVAVPSRVSGTHNNATTFRPYDPSRILGNTTPNLPVPSGGSSGCSVLQVVLVVVIIAVAVAATVYTAGAATALMTSGTIGGFGATMSLGATALAGGGLVAAGGATVTVGFGTALAAAAIGGAVGSIASQGLSMAVGMQKGFSWRQVAMGAVSSTVGAGVGHYAVGVGEAATKFQPALGWVAAGARGAVSSAATQGASYLLGINRSFSWHSVVAGAVGAAAGAAVKDFAVGWESGADLLAKTAKLSANEKFLLGAISGFGAGVAAAAARGGRVVVQQAATDAFGNALGNYPTDISIETNRFNAEVRAADAMIAAESEVMAAEEHNAAVDRIHQREEELAEQAGRQLLDGWRQERDEDLADASRASLRRTQGLVEGTDRPSSYKPGAGHAAQLSVQSSHQSGAYSQDAQDILADKARAMLWVQGRSIDGVPLAWNPGLCRDLTECNAMLDLANYNLSRASEEYRARTDSPWRGQPGAGNGVARMLGAVGTSNEVNWAAGQVHAVHQRLFSLALESGDFTPEQLKYYESLAAATAGSLSIAATSRRGSLFESGSARLETRGFRAPDGTRRVPEGIPKGWRIVPTDGEGGVRYYDPKNPGNSVRVMPGDPSSPYPNSQTPYVRWQRNGQPLDVNGNILPDKYRAEAHVPLKDFQFKSKKQ